MGKRDPIPSITWTMSSIPVVRYDPTSWNLKIFNLVDGISQWMELIGQNLFNVLMDQVCAAIQLNLILYYGYFLHWQQNNWLFFFCFVLFCLFFNRTTNIPPLCCQETCPHPILMQFSTAGNNNWIIRAIHAASTVELKWFDQLKLDR